MFPVFWYLHILQIAFNSLQGDDAALATGSGLIARAIAHYESTSTAVPAALAAIANLRHQLLQAVHTLHSRSVNHCLSTDATSHAVKRKGMCGSSLVNLLGVKALFTSTQRHSKPMVRLQH